MDTLIEKYRQQLLDSDFRAGCPVVAVAVEAGFEEGRERMASVTERAAAVFDRWTDLIAQRFIADGLPTDRATNWRCWRPRRSRGRSCWPGCGAT